MLEVIESKPPPETGRVARKTSVSALNTQSSPADEPATTNPAVADRTYFAQKYSRSSPLEGI